MGIITVLTLRSDSPLHTLLPASVKRWQSPSLIHGIAMLCKWAGKALGRIPGPHKYCTSVCNDYYLKNDMSDPFLSLMTISQQIQNLEGREYCSLTHPACYDTSQGHLDPSGQEDQWGEAVAVQRNKEGTGYRQSNLGTSSASYTRTLIKQPHLPSTPVMAQRTGFGESLSTKLPRKVNANEASWESSATLSLGIQMPIPRPYYDSDQWNQKPWGWDPEICFNKPPRRFVGTQGLRTSLEQGSMNRDPWAQTGPPPMLIKWGVSVT